MSVEKYLDGNEVLAESAREQEPKFQLGATDRLEALADLEILDAPTERSFELLAELACEILGTPVALVTLVTEERQFFVGSSGLGEPWSSSRETPLSHSFCQHVAIRNEPLVIKDAREHPLVCDNLAIKELNVIGYLGAPLVYEGISLGSFCAIDQKARDWTRGELDLLTRLAVMAASEFVKRKSTLEKQQHLENRLRQSHKMEAIGQLTAGVAHDFSNVLGAVQIYSDLIEVDCNEPAKTLTHLQQIQATIDSAKGVVQQLLNWSRPAQSDQVPVCLADLVGDSVPLLNAFLSPQVRIVFEECSDSGVILANTAQIQQVLFNLCGNAEHAMRDVGGDVQIKVESLELDEEAAKGELVCGRYVVLTVSDKGYGIPSDILHRIHDPYFTTKPVGEGTGLGLWTVFGIAHTHNATVEVDSIVNEGSTFRIFFPESSAMLEQPIESIVADPSVKKPNADVSYRVMIVDDDEVIVSGMEQQLEFSGYSVRAFTDPREALRVFESEPTAFDILVTDQIMPNLYGDELIRAIKKIRPSIPTIVCSGYSPRLSGNSSANSLAEAHGAEAHCKKPYRFKVLSDAIEGLLCPVD